MKKLSFIFLMCICGLTSCTNKTQSEAISAPSSQIIDATPVVAKESSVLEITPAAIKKTEIATENVPPQAQYTSDNDAGEAGTENENDEAESSENFSSESANKEDIDTDTFNEEYSISENSENNEESEREEESLPDITYEDGAPDETPSENYEYSEGGFSYYSIDDSNR